MRGITPSTISLSADYEKVRFTDVSVMCKKDEKATRLVASEAPYNAFRIDETFCMDESSVELDQWSVGVVILELLVGTDLVIVANSAQKLRDLLIHCGQYIDGQTHMLLSFLLFDYPWIDVQDYASCTLKNNPTLMIENIRGMDVALGEDRVL